MMEEPLMSDADKARKGRAARAKGARAERQVAAVIADLTGWQIKRRVRNHAGDSDLDGVPGFCVEVKDRAAPTMGDVRAWWRQTVEQAMRAIAVPVLFYKRQAGEWRAVWPMHAIEDLGWSGAYEMAVEGSVEAWSMVAREIHARSTLLEQNAPQSASVLEQQETMRHGYAD